MVDSAVRPWPSLPELQRWSRVHLPFRSHVTRTVRMALGSPPPPLIPVHSLLWSNDFCKTPLSLWEPLRHKWEEQGSSILMSLPSLYEPFRALPVALLFYLLIEQLLNLQDWIPVFPTLGRQRWCFFYTVTLPVGSPFQSTGHIVMFGWTVSPWRTRNFPSDSARFPMYVTRLTSLLASRLALATY